MAVVPKLTLSALRSHAKNSSAADPTLTLQRIKAATSVRAVIHLRVPI